MKKLAVLLPTYNAASYLKESMDSVLSQTFTDFDLYVYDDCSTDSSFAIISSYLDPRIFYVKNEKNIGLTKTLNKGLDDLLQQYEYIARMDADDWCYPERFEKQIRFLEQNPEIILCGTQGYWLKDLNLNPETGWTYPTASAYMKYYLLFGATLGHSSVILRSRTMMENHFRYDETKINCQDWELWTRISKVGKMANLPDFLMKYRILENSNHRAADKKNIHLQYKAEIISKYWSHFGISFSEDEVFDYYYEANKKSKKEFLVQVEKLISNFNAIFLQSKKELSDSDQGSFSYLLARRIVSYWRRSGISRKDPIIWLFVFHKVKFRSTMKLIKSLIK